MRLVGTLHLEQKDEWTVQRARCYDYSRSIKRYRTGFPGHPQAWLVAKMLGAEDDTVIE